MFMSPNIVNDYTKTCDMFHNKLYKQNPQFNYCKRTDVIAHVYLAKLRKRTCYCEIEI